MSNYTAEQVLTALTDDTAEWQHWKTGEWEPGFSVNDGWLDVGGKRLHIGSNVEVVDVVTETGGMDEGSAASVVFKVGDQLFKKDGYYQSHYGYDWDGDLYEVEAFEKTVTDYRTV